jgi:aminoglycoside 3-N-acetyltransferase
VGKLNSGAEQAIRKEVKRQLRMLRQRFIRTFYTFTPADLRACLVEIGIARGDSVLVHSSFDAFEGFTGKPTDVIAALMDAVGPEGTLLMPTLPFTGTAVAWVKENPVFDVARTPSRMGLITELFRRSPGVMRSVHPTHPVAAWGKDAEAYVAGHHLARTPCGLGSPFARLLERAGKILLLGVDIGSMTFYHCVEELLEPRFPVSPFTREIYQLSSRQKDGAIVVTQTRLFEPDVSRRRSLYRLAPELKRRDMEPKQWSRDNNAAESQRRLDVRCLRSEASIAMTEADPTSAKAPARCRTAQFDPFDLAQGKLYPAMQKVQTLLCFRPPNPPVPARPRNLVRCQCEPRTIRVGLLSSPIEFLHDSLVALGLASGSRSRSISRVSARFGKRS